MQLTLGFLDQSNPPIVRWEELDDDARRELLIKLARLIAKTVSAEDEERENDD